MARRWLPRCCDKFLSLIINEPDAELDVTTTGAKKSATCSPRSVVPEIVFELSMNGSVALADSMSYRPGISCFGIDWIPSGEFLQSHRHSFCCFFKNLYEILWHEGGHRLASEFEAEVVFGLHVLHDIADRFRRKDGEEIRRHVCGVD